MLAGGGCGGVAGPDGGRLSLSELLRFGTTKMWGAPAAWRPERPKADARRGVAIGPCCIAH